MQYRLALTAALLLALALPFAGQTQQVPESISGPSKLVETYQSWIVRCVTPKPAKGRPTPKHICEMAQDLTRKQDGQRLLSMGLQPSDKGASLTLVAPFGLLLSAGVTITIDGKSASHGEFRTCLPRGCISIINLSRKTLDRLKSGRTAKLAMRTTGGTDFAIQISLAGFSAAWKRLIGL